MAIAVSAAPAATAILITFLKPFSIAIATANAVQPISGGYMYTKTIM